MESEKLVIEEESCRICRSSEGGQILIFGLSGAERNIPTKIRECLPIKVSEKDGLPNTVCTDCAEKLDEFYAFREESRKTDSNLQDIYQSENKSDSDCSNSKTSDTSKEKVGALSIDIESGSRPKTKQATLAEPQADDYVLMKEETIHVDNTNKNSNVMADYLIEFNNNTKVKGDSEIQDLDILNAMRRRREVLPPMWDVFERCGGDGDKLERMEAKVSKGGKITRPILKGKFSVVHRRYIVSKNAFPCSLCGRCFLFNQGRPREGLSHTDADILPGQEQDLESVAESPTDGLYPCQQCGKLFPHKVSLKRHLLTHSDSKKFICRYCGKAFNRNEHLNRHVLSHTGGRPFQCDLCSKVFTRKEHLVRHRANHNLPAGKDDSEDAVTGEVDEAKPFVCEICNCAYARREQMAKHKKIAHGIDGEAESEAKPYSCNHCHKTFTRKEHLTRHKKIHVRQAFSGNFELSEGLSPGKLATLKKAKKDALIPLTVNANLAKLSNVTVTPSKSQVSVVTPVSSNKDTVTLEISAADAEAGKSRHGESLMNSILKNGQFGELSLVDVKSDKGGPSESDAQESYEESYYDNKHLTEEEKAQLEGFLAETSFASADFLSVAYDSDRRGDAEDEYALEKDSIDLEDLKKMPKCKICAKAFTKRNHLHRHLKRYHNLTKAQVNSGKFEIFENGAAGEMEEFDVEDYDDEGSPVSKRPKGTFPCRVCRKTFTRKYHMYRHQKTQHGIEFPTKDMLRCGACAAAFVTAEELLRHECLGGGGGGEDDDDDEDKPQRKPRNTFKCAICKSTFENHDGFKDHVCKKGHTCGTCGETFDKLRHLNRHTLEKHGEKQQQQQQQPVEPSRSAVLS